MKNNNPFLNTRIEFHILQSFPVSCLNRDDVGSPKTAVIGGSTRARVSSQCWKRQVRLEMNKLGVVAGTRTKLLGLLVAEACLKEGASEREANECGNIIQNIFSKNEDKKSKADDEGLENNDDRGNDTLMFLSPNEVEIIAQEFKSKSFKPELVITQKDAKKQAKELEKIIANKISAIDAIDIALFGRMIAQAAKMNVEAAASFSHAISTHKVNNEVEFFCALDDKQENQGAAHLGSLEYNSATYYRYISLDLGQLWQTLKGVGLSKAVDAFTKALFIAVPNARQTTMSGASQWDFAKILIRKGQRIQLPFETAVKAKDGGFLNPSIEYLTNELSLKEKRAGSLFCKEAEFTFGNSEFSIDDLVTSLENYLQKASL